MPKRVEFWKPIIGYGKLYEISNFGRIRARRIVRISPNKQRYQQRRRLLSVSLRNGIAKISLRDMEGNRKWYQLKDLVADHWLPGRTYRRQVLIKNGNPFDCRVWNLKEDEGERIKNQKLTKQEREEIKEKLKDRKYGDVTNLARKYKVSTSTIYRYDDTK